MVHGVRPLPLDSAWHTPGQGSDEAEALCSSCLPVTRLLQLTDTQVPPNSVPMDPLATELCFVGHSSSGETCRLQENFRIFSVILESSFNLPAGLGLGICGVANPRADGVLVSLPALLLWSQEFDPRLGAPSLRS